MAAAGGGLASCLEEGEEDRLVGWSQTPQNKITIIQDIMAKPPKRLPNNQMSGHYGVGGFGAMMDAMVS